MTKKEFTVLGLDVATTTGWAYSSGRTASDVKSGLIEMPKRKKGVKTLSTYQKTGIFTTKLHKLIRSNPKPDICVIEAPMSAGPNPTTLAQLNQLFGAAASTVIGYDIPRLAVLPATWRKVMFGTSSAKKLCVKDWKTYAVSQVSLEFGFDIGDDEAEAIWLSQYGFTTQTFKKMVLDNE